MLACSVASSFGVLHVLLAHVLDGAGEEAAGAAGGVEHRLAELRVDLVDDELRDGARRVVLAGVARALEVGEDAARRCRRTAWRSAALVEVDLVELVDDLPHQRAGLHVVVGVLEDAANHARDGGVLARSTGSSFSVWKRSLLTKSRSCVAGDALGVRRPGAPAEPARDRRLVVVLEQLLLGFVVVEDLEEEHPARAG